MMDRIKKTLLPIVTFVPIDVRRLFRDKVGIFFVFIFPLIFLLVFGTIFGNNNDDISVKVALLNQSESELATTVETQLKESDVFDVDEQVTTLEAANDKMSRSELSAAIVLPESFGAIPQGSTHPTGQAQLVYDQNNESAIQIVVSILEGYFAEINAEFVSVPEAPFTVASESTAPAGLSRLDYVFSGLLGFTLLSLGIFGPTTVFPRLKQRGVLRRYQTTTIRVWQYFVANVLSNAFIGLIAVAIMFAAALLIFDLNMRGSYLNLAAVVILGVVLLFGIGLAIGGWAKNENQAAPLAQLTTLPMMFLSGVFFPVFLMPEWLQSITRFIPLTPIVESLRLVITENASLFDLGPQMAVILGWTVVIYVVAFKVFRWE